MYRETRVLGYRWVPGYGFEGFPFEKDYPSRQAAYGRVRRAKTALDKDPGLADYYVSYLITKNSNGTWHLTAEVREIQ
jgi:hypothetical protein